MAIIKCNECGKDISDKSHACIECGAPISLLVSALDGTSLEQKQVIANTPPNSSLARVSNYLKDTSPIYLFASDYLKRIWPIGLISKRIFIAILAIIFVTWFYFSPHLAVHHIKSAFEDRDTAELADAVNFPLVKESLKASFNAKLAEQVTTSENSFEALGVMMAGAMVGPMVDALVTPENLAAMMKNGSLRPTQQADGNLPLDVSMGYETFNRFVVTAKRNRDEVESIGFVFHRDGLFSWKLSALRLPI